MGGAWVKKGSASPLSRGGKAGDKERSHSSLGGLRDSHLKDGDDDPKEANGTAKDLHDENFYKEAGVLGIGQGSPTAHDAHADSTKQVGQTDCEASPKHGVAWRIRSSSEAQAGRR